MNKSGRNTLCACGSGKKYKHCCLGNATSQTPVPPPEKLSIPTALQTALEHLNLGHLAEAEAINQQILSLEPNHADALHLQGIIAYQRGNHQLAATLISRAITANPIEATFYGNLGKILKELGQLDEAIVNYHKALSINPDFAEAHNNLGDALEKQGKLNEAATCYHQALLIRPDFAEAHNNLGNVYEREGKLDEAITCYNQALLIRPDFAETYNNLGNAHERKGQLDEAAVCYSQALTAKSDLAEPYLNLSSILMNTGRVSEAITLLEIALAKVQKGTWRVASLASVAYWTQGLYGEASNLVNRYFAAALSDVQNRHSLRQNIFFTYIVKLLEHRESRPGLYALEGKTASLIVLGDSHSLSPANTSFEWCGTRITASSRLISGIKMFHLGKSENKQYSIYFSTHLRALDPTHHLLFTIGEIDCRPGEGIWTAYRKKKHSLSDIIASSVDGYLSCIADQILDRNFASITVQGIPAPAYSLSGEFDPDDKPAFLAMIRSVNTQLHSGAISRGWQFLDTYAATVGTDGSSNRKWDLDGFHLAPAFYADAMQWLR